MTDSDKLVNRLREIQTTLKEKGNRILASNMIEDIISATHTEGWGQTWQQALQQNKQVHHSSVPLGISCFALGVAVMQLFHSLMRAFL